MSGSDLPGSHPPLPMPQLEGPHRHPVAMKLISKDRYCMLITRLGPMESPCFLQSDLLGLLALAFVDVLGLEVAIRLIPCSYSHPVVFA